uniref:ANK_REP_REGION domain-containing protein n=1 Tax=Steinernema glaseri TaxID=37863 RepID=A0A1I7ZMP2_9BILA
MSDTEYSSPWPSQAEALENAIHQKDDHGRVPIHFRAQAKGTKMLERILEIDESHLEITDNEGHTPLMMAIIAGNSENAEFLLDHNANIDHQDNEKHSVVHYAVENAQLRLLKRLLRMNAKVGVPDKTGAQPLHYATRIRDTPPEVCHGILEELLKAGANTNARDIDSRTPILWAAIHGNKEAMNSIIEAGGNKLGVDREQLGVLHCAANYGHAHIIEYILDNTDRDIVHWKDKNGNTPIFYAASNGHLECVDILLRNEANPNEQDKRLRTPSHCAAARGHIKVLQLLKQYGASFEFGNYSGDLPIHEAIQSKSIPCVEYLMRMQPQAINAANYKGRTPLHLAAACENLEMVRLLCGKGANVNPLMLNKNRLLTPLDIATLRKHEEIIALLRENSALNAAEFPDNEIETVKSNIKETYISAQMNRPPFKEITQPSELRQRSGDVQKAPRTRVMAQFTRRSSSIESEQPMRTQKCTSTSDLPQSRQSLRLGAEAEDKIRKIIHEELENSALNVKVGEQNSEDEAPVKKDNLRVVSSHAPRRKGKLNVHQRRLGDIPHAASFADAEEAIFDHETDLRKIRKTLYGSEAHSDSEMPRERRSSDDVTGRNDKERKVVEFDEEQLFENDWKEIKKIKKTTNQNSQLRLVHEKAIFQELTHLKRIQLQYGKVQEKILVRSLVQNFCKMHGLNPAHFRYQTFYSWEKFLYEQLKLIYLEERERLLAGHASASATTASRAQIAATQKSRAELQKLISMAGKSPIRRQKLYANTGGHVHEGTGGKRCHCLSGTSKSAAQKESK